MVRGIYQKESGKIVSAFWEGASGDWKEAAKAVADTLKKRTGFVTLVGAGPGDPKLITVKGLEALKACDAVVYDSLASDELLNEVRPELSLIHI